jgi:isoquinoline 1-oxidoreductase beta subunit
MENMYDGDSDPLVSDEIIQSRENAVSPAAEMKRRDFLKVVSTAGAGLVLAVVLPPSVRGGSWREELLPGANAQTDTFVPNVWLRVDRSGAVTIIVAKSEMGQGVFTALPMIVAEELDADWSMVHVEQALADNKYGGMGTGGSTSVRTSWDHLRTAGAAARSMLVSAAAKQWEVPASSCETDRGVVHHRPSGRSLGYGEVAEEASKLPLPEKPDLKDPKDFRIIGKRTLRLDSPGKVDGTSIFGIDTTPPGMLYAAIARPPVFGAKLVSFDDAATRKIEGVTAVRKIPEGVAVFADSTWSAFQGRDALSIKWDEGKNAKLTSAMIAQKLLAASSKAGAVGEESGNAADALKKSHTKLEAVYEAPFLAHASLEPMNCTADVRKDSCVVWAPTQDPQGVRRSAASIAGLQESQVTVHTTFLGGGFGRKFDHDFTTEAIHCSKAIGAPVKVTWTREDDMRFGKYRPVSRHLLSGGLDAQGNLTTLIHKVVAPSISDQERPGSLKGGVDRSALEGATELPYAIPNLRVEYVLARTPVPIWFWRSVYPSQNVFALECFIDELAAEGGKDPLEFRLGLTGNSPRMKQVLSTVAEHSGWGTPLPAGRFRGIACAPPAFFKTYVAHVAEVSIAGDNTIRVHRVVTAIDCGIVVNPETVEAQMEGCIVFGLSAALKGEITIDKGRVVQGNYDDYPLMTIDEMPVVEVHMIGSSEPPSGTGEPGLPPIAPAVANAVFAATGKRLRRMPFRLGS